MPTNYTKPATFSQALDTKLLRLLIDRIEDYAIFMLDPNGYILSWNQGAQNIKGYTSDEIIGQHISVFYTEEDKKRNVPRLNLNEALKNNIHESEGWRVRKNGSKFWANVVFTTLYDDNGHLTGFAKITRDISLKKINEDQQAELKSELEKRVLKETKKITANERRFRKLIENSHDGIALFDRNLDIFYRSQSAERINGWTAAERTGHSLETLIHPDDLAAVKAMFLKVMLEPGGCEKTNYRTLHKKGHYIWIQCILNNWLDDADIGAIVCNFTDITEQVKAQEQIRDKNRQIENILESITDGFVALDKNLCYTYANCKIGEMVSCPPESLIGKNIWDLFPELVGSSTQQALEQALKTGQYTWNEGYYAPAGLWHENNIYPSDDGLSVFIRDITQRKLAEASVQQSESNLRSIFENTDLAIVLFDMDAKILSFNHNAQYLASQHFHKELETGKSAFYYCTLKRRPYIRQILQKVREQSPIVYEISYDLPENQTTWFEVRWVNVVDQFKNPVGIILTLKDITGKKLADLERDRITADLLQQNKDLEQFTYIISHNLRAPVANIRGLSNLLSDAVDPGDTEGVKLLDALSSSVCTLDKVILDLNHILQVNSAANDTLEMVSLPHLVDDVKLITKQLTDKHKATIDCHFEEVDHLLSLKSYLYSIFQNLIVNSIKYRRTGVNPVINITSKLDKDKVCLYFEDNGKGIDIQRFGEHLFGLYKRFDLSVEGKGMGLFMVKMQVERLGGKISVKSEVNQGTEFTLEFPLKH